MFFKYPAIPDKLTCTRKHPVTDRMFSCTLRGRELHPGLKVLSYLFFQKGMDYTIFSIGCAARSSHYSL